MSEPTILTFVSIPDFTKKHGYLYDAIELEKIHTKLETKGVYKCSKYNQTYFIDEYGLLD